jgi:hypothetical protein
MDYCFHLFISFHFWLFTGVLQEIRRKVTRKGWIFLQKATKAAKGTKILAETHLTEGNEGREDFVSRGLIVLFAQRFAIWESPETR